MNGWYAIVAFACGFVLAQTIKFFVGLFSGKTRSMRESLKTAVGYLMRSGGMPSGHSAATTALTVYLGLWQGFDSGLFALAVGFTLIVLYDAIHVRYAVGVQGEALNKILQSEGKKTLPLVEGHTPMQMMVGVTLGLIIGVIMWLITKG